ncbi:hypothetical protein DFQ28_006553 [Apophysomyces sp. BC1034]|nr:hypothetical protein DFQ30_006755 [Apophysomyces sp. BC1015]KAG0176783.1 hypothetical protein DFQ29_005650 [Apophysomyces sp. BC1021]KAG0187283.1 hypothetical protein DFQ28_006553 [Apophysomyces sp. BC1034]
MPNVALPVDDLEKQPLCTSYRCPCATKTNSRSRDKKWLAAFGLFFLAIVGLHYLNLPSEPHIYNTSELAYAEAVCRNPSIPWSGESVFQVPETYKGLHVDQSDNHGVTITSDGHNNVRVVQNSTVDRVTVVFDIKVANENDQDRIWIEQKVLSDGVLGLFIKHDRQRKYPLCANLDILIQLPEHSSLDILKVGIVHSDISVQEDLVFSKKLNLATVKGDIIVNNVTAGNSKFASTSGIVHAMFNSLDGNLDISAVKGDLSVFVSKVAEDVSSMKLSTVSGSVDLSLPRDYDSQFKLSTISGSTAVKSQTTPEKIHINGSNWGHNKSGYYGDNNVTQKRLGLSTVHGDIVLAYDL